MSANCRRHSSFRLRRSPKKRNYFFSGHIYTPFMTSRIKPLPDLMDVAQPAIGGVLVGVEFTMVDCQPVLFLCDLSILRGSYRTLALLRVWYRFINGSQPRCPRRYRQQSPMSRRHNSPRVPNRLALLDTDMRRTFAARRPAHFCCTQ